MAFGERHQHDDVEPGDGHDVHGCFRSVVRVHAAIMRMAMKTREAAGARPTPCRRARIRSARRSQPGATPGDELAEVWKSLASVGVPADALAQPRATTWTSATSDLEPAADAVGRGARPSATGASPAPDWAAIRRRLPRRDVPAQRAHVAAAWPRASRPTRRPRRGSASRCCSGSTRRRRATSSPSIRKRRRRRSRAAARASPHGMTQLWNDVQQGHLSQTDESAFEVGRNVATTRARWSSRTSSSSCSSTSR